MTQEEKEIDITDEILELIQNISDHEGGHAFISLYFGIPLRKVELTVKGDKHSGTVIWNDLTGVSDEQMAICTIAGFAGEIFIMGEEYVVLRGFKGFETDSKRLNSLGFDTQEKKALIALRALEIFSQHKESFIHLQQFLAKKLTEQVRAGEDTLILNADDLMRFNIQKSEFRN